MTPSQKRDIEAASQAIRSREGPDLDDYLYNIAAETGGYFKPAQRGNTWDTQYFEISLHGVYGQGPTSREAANNWLRCADHVLHADAGAERERAE